MTSPLMMTPAIAAARFPPRVHPIMLTMRAIGGVRSIVSPPRAESGEPHPGGKTISNTNVTGATSDSQNPARPAPERGSSGGRGPVSVLSRFTVL